MILIDNVKNEELRDIRFVLTDMDETLTYQGRLQARTYESLERLQDAGIKVIPVTAASAGWADQMARMWPVDGVIAENGGLFLIRNTRNHDIDRHYWHEDEFLNNRQQLRKIQRLIQHQLPWLEVSDDQDFRLTSIAFKLPSVPKKIQLLVDELKKYGCSYTINNLWVLGWLGQYDKLLMSRRILNRFYALEESDEQESVYYSGDSLNDAPMFKFYKKSLGMNSINNILKDMPALPSWISKFPGGKGFVDGAIRILNAKEENVIGFFKNHI
ncbi:HAD family hydrolase [Pectobacterium carotovorum]|uniref:HAD-IIB family hydrolase n=1 Tax=Pectobacterium aquaticum TaxID=2204145 RepID=UPI000C7F0B6B|nr:HAD-IIB family hydrolase [Pectobacterium aquaticum]PLY37554.1 HAD family hydrolase [Pectobacterium carotovorum]RRO06770.1 HAD-IIB family hydrolase [Pectobacterium aquaticum]